jgi:hypothetical protein
MNLRSLLTILPLNFRRLSDFERERKGAPDAQWETPQRFCVFALAQRSVL